MNIIRPVKPEIARKLKEYSVDGRKMEVLTVLHIMIWVFMIPLLISLSFVFSDMLFFKKVSDFVFNVHFYYFSILLVAVIIICIAESFALDFELAEDYIEKLEKIYSEACRGNVFKVHEEMELDGEKFVVPFFYNGAVSAKFAKALNNAEVKLGKKKGLYNFLAKILFCKQR